MRSAGLEAVERLHFAMQVALLPGLRRIWRKHDSDLDGPTPEGAIWGCRFGREQSWQSGKKECCRVPLEI